MARHSNKSESTRLVTVAALLITTGVISVATLASDGECYPSWRNELGNMFISFWSDHEVAKPVTCDPQRLHRTYLFDIGSSYELKKMTDQDFRSMLSVNVENSGYSLVSITEELGNTSAEYSDSADSASDAIRTLPGFFTKQKK